MHPQDIFQKSNLMHEFGLDMSCKDTASAATLTAAGAIAGNNGHADDGSLAAQPTATAAAMDFIFGNPSAALASNGKHDIEQALHAGDASAAGADATSGNSISSSDCGPETDVDAADEPTSAATAAARNPLQAEHEQFFSEFTTSPARQQQPLPRDAVEASAAGNPFGDYAPDVDNKFSGDFEPHQQQFDEADDVDEEDDNKRDDRERDECDDGEYAPQVITTKRLTSVDFSEKKEYSFEREEYEKEVDSLADVPSVMQELASGVAVATSEEQLTSLASSGHISNADEEEEVELGQAVHDVDADGAAAASPLQQELLDSSAEDDEGRIVEDYRGANGDGETALPTVNALTVQDLAAMTADSASDDDADVAEADVEHMKVSNLVELGSFEEAAAVEHGELLFVHVPYGNDVCIDAMRAEVNCR